MLLLPEIIGSLAVVALLASAYGSIRACLHNTPAQLALGLAFGLVAMFQMNAPIDMVPGVILDMRNVPVALAGAFLGRRGALLCLAIAVGTRFSIGGVGMPSGIAAMMIACAAGYVWNRYTMRAKRRGIVQLIVLSSACERPSSCGILAALGGLRCFLCDGRFADGRAKPAVNSHRSGVS